MPYKNSEKDKAAKKRSYIKHFAKNKIRLATLYASNRTAIKKRSQAWRKANRAKMLSTLREYRRTHLAYTMLIAARYRAKKTGVTCTIVEADIFIPSICPVLGIPLAPATTGKWSPGSPSLDRIIPEIGYVKGNVRVISWRANNLKRDGTAEEFERIAAYIRGEL